MRKCIAFILILLSQTAAAATYYVGPEATGTGSGADRSNLKAFTVFRDTTSAPGDVALLQPGSYGAFGFKPQDTPFSNLGTAANYIVYRADPATCTTLPADWWTRTDPAPRPDYDHQAVFTNLSIDFNRAPGGQWNVAAVTGIELDGLVTYGPWAGASINCTNSYIRLHNLTILSDHSLRYSTTPAYGITLRYNSGNGGDLHDIDIHDCYIEGSDRALWIYGRLTSNVSIHDIHSLDSDGGGLFWCPNVQEAGYQQVISHCKFERRYATGNDTGAYIYGTVTAVNGGSPKRIFTGTNAPSGAYTDYVDLIHAGGATEYRALASYDGATMTLVSDLDANVTVGDGYKIYDASHESGFSIYAGNLTLDSCLFRSSGGTAPTYAYRLAAGGIDNLHLINSIWYCPGSSGTSNVALHCPDQSANAMLGNGFWMINCAVLGGMFYYYDKYDDERAAMNYYSVGVELGAYTGTDTSTWIISNNVIPGTLNVTPPTLLDNATVTCNHVYYVSSDKTTWPGLAILSSGAREQNPKNWGNAVLYGGQAKGSEPHPFSKGGAYFLATSADFENIYAGGMQGKDFTADLHPASGAPTVDAGDGAYAPTTDFDGAPRGSRPDVGPFESQESEKPLPAVLVSPPNSAVDQPVTGSIVWSDGGGAATYDVYFGTDSTPDAGELQTSQAGTSWTFPTLSWDTTYYWRIDSVNEAGVTTGGVYSFATREHPQPYLIAFALPGRFLCGL